MILASNPELAVEAATYAYVDLVLEKPKGHLAIFLPSDFNVLERGYGHTYNEIVRALEYFPTHYERIHFVTGLYDITPAILSAKVKKIQANYSLQQRESIKLLNQE